MYDLIGYEPDDDLFEDDLGAVAGYEDDFDDDGLDAIAGLDDFEDLDDGELDALASGYELVGYDPELEDLDEMDLAVAGYDDDFDDDGLDAIAGAEDDYDIPGSVEELLDGATSGRRLRRRRPRRRRARPIRRRRSVRALRAIRAARRQARIRGRRTTRVVRGLSRRLRAERVRSRRAMHVARRVATARRAPRPARSIPSVTGGTTQVVPKTPQVSGPQVVPFSSDTPIAPGETRVLTARPQVVFRPERLTVAARLAEYFRINAVRVGNVNQFAASGAVPAEAFSGTSPMPIGNTTAHPGHDITIEVTNTTSSPQEFSAAMSGPALQ
ncbi:MAG: hypothetical protein RLP09_20520 [Sandaracinaceae bacterium]